MRKRVSFHLRARERLRAVPLVAALFLAAPGIASADDGFLPALPTSSDPATLVDAVAQAMPALPTVDSVAAAAPAAVAAPADAAAQAVQAAQAPVQAAQVIPEPPAAQAAAPQPPPTPADPGQYREAQDRYQSATAPKVESKPAPDAAPASSGAADAPAPAAADTGTSSPQFVWNWVWHCAPAMDVTSVELPDNLPDNAVINWVWDSSCSPADSGSISDQYQQQNFVVSIRVNSPGDDGAIIQGNVIGAAAGPGVGASPVATPPAGAPVAPALAAIPLAWAPGSLTAFPLPGAVLVPLAALANAGSAVAAPAEPAAGAVLGLALPERAPPRSRGERAPSGAAPGAAVAASSPWAAAAAPALAAHEPARGRTAARPRVEPAPSRASRKGRSPGRRSPFDSLPVNAAGAASGGAGASSGVLVSALGALLAAFLLWPPVQGARVISVAGGPRKRVDGRRLERPG